MNSLLLCVATVGGFKPDSSRWQFTPRVGRVAVGTVYLFLFMLHGLVLDLALCWTTTRDIYIVMDIVMDDANYVMDYGQWICM
jgi:hypothetical protein